MEQNVFFRMNVRLKWRTKLLPAFKSFILPPFFGIAKESRGGKGLNILIISYKRLLILNIIKRLIFVFNKGNCPLVYHLDLAQPRSLLHYAGLEEPHPSELSSVDLRCFPLAEIASRGKTSTPYSQNMAGQRSLVFKIPPPRLRRTHSSDVVL